MSSTESNERQEQAAVAVATNPKKKLYLLISNPAKSTHLGTLLRCAAAFQVHQVLLVGYDKFNCQGSFGSHLFLDIVVFPSWDCVHDYLRRGGGDEEDNGDTTINDSECAANDDAEKSNSQEKGCDSSTHPNPITIMGILGAYGGGEEIFSPEGMEVYEDSDNELVSLVSPKDTKDPEQHNHKKLRTSSLPHRSLPIDTRPFSTSVCFILSKDRRGLPISQAQLCSGFVHLPHLCFDDDSSTGIPQTIESNSAQSSMPKEPPSKQTITPSVTQSTLLETATVLSTVLHHYTAWARYEERSFTADNQKFVKEVKPNNLRRRLCRVYKQSSEKKEKKKINVEEEHGNTDQGAMNAMMLFNGPGDAAQGSDY